MPNGGQISSGVGLQLQSGYPGNPDNGNFAATGSGRVGNTLEAAGGTQYTNWNELFGTPFWNPASAPNAFNSFCVALVAWDHASAKPAIHDSGAPNNPVKGAVVIGANAAAQNNGCIAIGYTANAVTAVGGAIDEGGNVAIGQAASAFTAGRTFGADYCSVAVGRNAQAKANEWSVVIGSGLTRGQRSILIGYGGISVGHDRTILIDTDGNGSVSAGQIQIGNINHTGPITIGPLNLTASVSAIQGVPDADVTLIAPNGTILYTAITAARVVNLMAANAVPAGFRVLVTDTSGNASAINTITLTRAGADKINGATTVSIILPYGCREIMSDGVSKWTIIRSI